jgi:dTDP-4-amino-4,6-dideoxygalactose transaminase
MIPFSPPFIDEDIITEVKETLLSEWITTGSKVKCFEREISRISNVNDVLCVNSATSGLMLALKWFGIGDGDEVIVPSYTYCATALAVYHLGAKIVMVDVNDDFTIDPEKIRRAVTPETKAIIPVDIAGWPAHYDDILKIVKDPTIHKMFNPKTEEQKQLGRILVLADAAHSLGAFYNGEPTGSLADITVFSFHAVKNITTAEGGAICIRLQTPFVNKDVYKKMKLMSLNGQTKDAFTKTTGKEWRYDIVLTGYKMNMPDVCAAIGLAQIRKYRSVLLPRRKFIANRYQELFSKFKWAQLPDLRKGKTESSYHIYPLRIKGISETQRDALMDEIFAHDVSVNVHFIPMPLLSVFKSMGYKIEDHPIAYSNYSREISLPIYPQLKDEQIEYIVKVVESAVNYIIGDV